MMLQARYSLFSITGSEAVNPHPFLYYTGSVYFSSEQSGEIVKEATHVCKVNTLEMDVYFAPISILHFMLLKHRHIDTVIVT
jgi:hypothetical protein